MKIVSKIALTLVSVFLCLTASYSGIPNNDNPTTFLGPTLKGSFTDALNNRAAYSLLGEAGFRNFRAGGTLGWMISPNQRAKASIDFLTQKITYPFFSGNTSQWMTQGSISADYEIDVGGPEWGFPQFDINGFLSHAPSRSLSTVMGTFMRDGIIQNFVNERRIAGSNAGGLSPGVSIQPWLGGRAGAQLNYDKVHYDTRWKNHDAIGFGGTVFFDQAVTNNVNINLLAAVRKPFNNYQAGINWINIPYFFGATAVGIEGAYTAGKTALPSTYNASVTFDYFMDRNITPGGANRQIVRDFLAYTGTPAVYLPEVLAVPDERVTITNPVCPFAPPTLIATIPDQNPPAGQTNIDISPHFAGENLTFGFSVIQAPTVFGDSVQFVAPSTVRINSVAPTFTDTAIVQVSATNACGTVAQAFTINYGIPS